MNNWNTKLPGLHRTQHLHKVKRFDENAVQNVSNFNFMFLKTFILLPMNCSQLNTQRRSNVNMAST